MIYLVSELIQSVRNHIDADEVAPGQWVPDATMISWLNRGVNRLWRKMARAGRVQPIITSTSGTPPFVFGNGADDGDPMVVYGVAEVLSDGTDRPLRYAQAGIGNPPYQVQSWTGGGPGQVWWVDQVSDGLDGSNYRVNVAPATTSGTYKITWLPGPLPLVSGASGVGNTNQIDIPAGFDEYPVLYAARMCFARAGAAPPSLQRMLDEMEAELDTAAETFAQGNAPRVINRDRELRGWARRGQEVNSGWGNTANWWWAP
jgi:hypothetical protein